MYTEARSTMSTDGSPGTTVLQLSALLPQAIMVLARVTCSVAGGETPPPSLHASVARRDGGRSPANTEQ